MLPDMLRLLLLSASLLALACSSKPRDPEAEVRAAVAALEKAVEERDIGRIEDLLADGYKDDKRYDKGKLVSTLQFIFLRKQSIHALGQVGSQSQGARAARDRLDDLVWRVKASG